VRLRRVFPLLVAWATLGAAPFWPPPSQLLEDIKILAAPEMEGRASGTPGGERAARYLIDAFREAGLRPGRDSGYALEFAVPARVALDGENALGLAGPASRSFAVDTDWIPMGGSAAGEVEGEVVFVGYGISAPDLGYDDYRDIDVSGRIVLALGGEPRRNDPASPFARAYLGGYGQRLHKARAAAAHGARALLLVARPDGADTLPSLLDGRATGGILTAAVTRATAEAMLGASGLDMARLRQRIDAGLAPASQALPGVRVRLTVRLVRTTGVSANIVGILPGTDPVLAREAVVVGAHYDHLGRTGEGALDPEQRTAIHPGADDNASGTAAVLALARAFAAAGGASRTLVFALFAGEELGFVGSSAYLREPVVPLARTVAMVNLDMVGRMREHRLYVGGLDSGRGLEAIVAGAAAGLDLRLEQRPSPYAPSDHLSFYQRRVPVLFFHTGVHEDYHRSTDTWDRINADGLARVVVMAERVIGTLARAPAPSYVEVVTDRPETAVGGTYPGGGTAFLGVAARLGDDAPGVPLSFVQPGTAAARAGLQAGDVIVRVGGLRVYSFDELHESIVARQPGDSVDVVYLRDGETRQVSAVLGGRP
jgi:hypothetical protein